MKEACKMQAVKQRTQTLLQFLIEHENLSTVLGLHAYMLKVG